MSAARICIAGAVCAAVAAGSLVAAQRSAGRTASCTPLPASLLGTYRRADTGSFRLTFTKACRFKALDGRTVEGDGDYARSAGGATGGTIVFSNDKGCRGTGMQDLPTPYKYVVKNGVLKLSVVGGTAKDLCVDPGGDGRPRALEGHGGFVREISGKAVIKAGMKKGGRFAASGAFKDSGDVVVESSKTQGDKQLIRAKLASTRGTIRISEQVILAGTKKGTVTWDVVSGAGVYVGLHGDGAGTAVGPSQSLNGSVSN